MNHQGPLEAPSMVACFHHKIPTGLYFVQDAPALDGRFVIAAGTIQPDDFMGETVNAPEKHIGNSCS